VIANKIIKKSIHCIQEVILTIIENNQSQTDQFRDIEKIFKI